jgi:propanediol dehydratase small subunit
MTNDYRYPLSEHEANRLKAASERPLNDITFEKAVAGELQPDDLRIHAETLRAQAEIARQAGHPQLAANLLRAAELTVVPSDELLKIYDLLRPGRASLETLHALAARLEQQYQAAETARFVREAADVYAARGLLRRKA